MTSPNYHLVSDFRFKPNETVDVFSYFLTITYNNHVITLFIILKYDNDGFFMSDVGNI